MHQLKLGNKVFEGENNSYLFLDGSEVVLIDTGIPTPDIRSDLETGLGRHGLAFSDIDIVFLTHFHADHSGLAAQIQEASGATVYAHPNDAPMIEGDPNALADYRDRQLEYFERWKMPQEKRDALIEYMDSGPVYYAEEVATEPFEDGDRFDIGETELRVIHTPGHTSGLSSFELTDRNEVLTGDALLPVYTPNVGGADVRTERPLERYLETLERLAAFEFDRAWPGHRDVIDEPSDRARFIVAHHEERAYRVIRVLNTLGSADAWTVSAELFGELERIHILHGPGEAFAHLEHLVDRGDVVRDGDSYQITDDTRERFDARDDESWPLRPKARERSINTGN